MVALFLARVPEVTLVLGKVDPRILTGLAHPSPKLNRYLRLTILPSNARPFPR